MKSLENKWFHNPELKNLPHIYSLILNLFYSTFLSIALTPKFIVELENFLLVPRMSREGQWITSVTI